MAERGSTQATYTPGYSTTSRARCWLLRGGITDAAVNADNGMTFPALGLFILGLTTNQSVVHILVGPRFPAVLFGGDYPNQGSERTSKKEEESRNKQARKLRFQACFLTVP